MKIAALFTGQGSQYVGMGKDLYDNYPLVKFRMDKTSEILGCDIEKICFEGPEEDLKKTENTQPAIYMISFICYRLLENAGVKFDAYAGFSLGEYSALAASGRLTYEDGVKLVQERGIIMERAVPAGAGAMAAILGLEDSVVEDVCAKVKSGIVVPANYNCPGQLVISGEKAAVEEACALASEAGAKRAVVLNVSGPFHSPMLKEASVQLKEKLDALTFQEGNALVYSNVTAMPHSQETLKDMLVKQMYSPVQWRKTIENLLADGFDTFVEVGPGKTLAGFVRKIDRNATIYSVSNVESFETTVKALKNA